MVKLNTLRIQKILELAEVDGRALLKDLVEVETSISEYKKTLESLLKTFNKTSNEIEDEPIAF